MAMAPVAAAMSASAWPPLALIWSERTVGTRTGRKGRVRSVVGGSVGVASAAE